MLRKFIGENLEKKYIFSNYLPLQIWILKICNHDISKTITARSFKLYQLIEDDEYSSVIFFLELSSFADLDFEIL